MNDPEPGSDAWLAQVSEEPLQPERPIVDPRRRLWVCRL